MESTPTTPENLKVMPSVFSTPETNPNYDIQTTNSVKENVRLVSPNGGLCLLTNARYPVRHCHCLPRKFMKDGEIVCYTIYPILVSKFQIHLLAREA